jgi:hypothetical protein
MHNLDQAGGGIVPTFSFLRGAIFTPLRSNSFHPHAGECGLFGNAAEQANS